MGGVVRGGGMGGVVRGGGGESVQSLGATNGVGESIDHCRGVWEHLKPASPEAHKDCFNERDENRAKGQRGEKRDMAFNIHNQVEQTRIHTNPVCVIYMDIETWEQTKKQGFEVSLPFLFYLARLFQGIWEVVRYVGVVDWNELAEEWSDTQYCLLTAAHVGFWMVCWCITSRRFVLDYFDYKWAVTLQ